MCNLTQAEMMTLIITSGAVAITLITVIGFIVIGKVALDKLDDEDDDSETTKED